MCFSVITINTATVISQFGDFRKVLSCLLVGEEIPLKSLWISVESVLNNWPFRFACLAIMNRNGCT